MKKSKVISIFCLLAFTITITFSACGYLENNESNNNTSEQSAESSDNISQAEVSNVSSEQQSEPSNFSAAESNTESSSDNKVEDLLSKMTTEEKVGQMFYVRCPDSNAVEKISEYHLGGYILFGRDFNNKTKDEVITAINSYQGASSIPMLIGVDEEGGSVVRVSSNPNLRSTPFLSPSDTFKNGGWSAIESDAREKAELLLSLGINVNMAPVCDITSDPNAFMYYRSFSDNVKHENQFVKTVVEISKKNKLGTVLKHFPGYGNNEDTHTGIAYDNREYSEFKDTDFKPFEAGISAGADCILISHNIVSCMDENYPASLSENVHKIIRENLNFDGVIMTDDLYMDAIRNYTDDSEAAVIAAKAGNDILCCTDFETQYPAVLEAVESNEIPMSQVDDSVRRILQWKINLGLI